MLHLIRSIYAINFSIIMSNVPLLYILNHPDIFKIGFYDTNYVLYIIPFIQFKSYARYSGVLALFNNYFYGKDNYYILKNLLIFYTLIILTEYLHICFYSNISINFFAFTYFCKQYFYGSIDYCLDQLDNNYNQNYRVIGYLLLLFPLFGIIFNTFLIDTLNILYISHIVCLIYNIYKLNTYNISYINEKETKKIDRYIDPDKCLWNIIMLLMVSYVDSIGDAIATEKSWNSKEIKYFTINMFVKIIASLATHPSIQNRIKFTNKNKDTIIGLIIMRFLLLIIMNIQSIYFKEFLFFLQCSIDIYAGTIFMNDYLKNSKDILWTSKSTKKYKIPVQIVYFLNENVPPLLKLYVSTSLILLGKQIDIGILYVLPLLFCAICIIKLIPCIQNKIKN